MLIPFDAEYLPNDRFRSTTAKLFIKFRKLGITIVADPILQLLVTEEIPEASRQVVLTRQLSFPPAINTRSVHAPTSLGKPLLFPFVFILIYIQ